MRRYAVALIIVGILLAAYPGGERIYVHLWQQRALSRLASEPPVPADGETANAYATLNNQPTAAGTASPVTSPETTTGSQLAILSVPRLGLELPMFDRASDFNMKIGVGQIKGTSTIGTVGNAAFAGHRRYSLSRLDEIVVDEQIIIQIGDRSLNYRVYAKTIVEPTDVSVLNRSRTDSVLTLITCHPADTFKQRLIIHAVLVPR